MRHFKGKLILEKNFIFKKIIFNSKKANDYYDIELKFKNQIFKNFSHESNIFLKEMDNDNAILSNDFKKVIFKMLEKTIVYKKCEVDIIYEEIFDKYGNAYGKEIITGLIFPLFNYNDLDVDLNYIIKKNIPKNWIKIKGNFIPSIKNNPDIGCYLLKEGSTNLNEIETYKNGFIRVNGLPYNNSDIIKQKVFKLDEMNYIAKSIFNISTQSNQQNSNLISNNSLQQTSINISDIQSTSNSISTNSPTSTKLETLKNIRNLLNYLPDEDIALLKDMTNNNLDDPNILEYLKMSRNEKLEFLSKAKNFKMKKISLKKEKKQ